jgi:hypothetical protein
MPNTNRRRPVEPQRIADASLDDLQRALDTLIMRLSDADRVRVTQVADRASAMFRPLWNGCAGPPDADGNLIDLDVAAVSATALLVSASAPPFASGLHPYTLLRVIVTLREILDRLSAEYADRGECECPCPGCTAERALAAVVAFVVDGDDDERGDGLDDDGREFDA